MKLVRQAALVAMALIVLLQCGPAQEEPARSGSLVTVKFALRTHLTFAPLAIAKERGYFAEEGLDVELVDLWPSDALVALPLGEVDAIGVPVFAGLFNAMEHESSIQVVADKGHVGEGCSLYSIVARADLLGEKPLEPADLRGRRIERKPGSIYDFIMERLFERHGLSWEDVEEIEMMPPHLSAAGFETGQLDFKFAAEPILTILEDEGLARPWMPVAEIVPGLQFSAVVFGSRLIRDQPDLGHRFMRAYLRGVRTYNEGPTDQNVAIVAEFANLDESLLRRVCWSPIDPNGMVRVEGVQEFIDWLRADGLVSQELTVDQWWNPSFAEEASRRLGVSGRTPDGQSGEDAN